MENINSIINAEVLVFILAVLVLAFVSAALKKGFLIITIPIKCVIGGILIYIINIFASKIPGLSIPLNPLTASIVGVLQVPGLALVLMIKYLIYPM